MPMSTSAVAEAMDEEDEAKQLRKAAKRLAKEAASADKVHKEAMAEEGDDHEAEAKRQRKAARRTAKEAAAVAEAMDEGGEAKQLRRTAKRLANDAASTDKVPNEANAEEEEDHEAKAKRQRKDARRAAKEAAAQAESAVENTEKGEGNKKSLKVFIKGLPFSKDADTLRKDFSKCGEITDFQVPVDQQGSPKGYAFVSYATQAGANAAYKLHNTNYGGRNITVVEATDAGKGKGKQSDWNCPNCNDVVFARNSECRQCGTARPGGGEVDDVKDKSKGREGDWRCPSCSDLVFARNSHCRKCGAEKPGGGGGDDNENTIFIRGLPSSATEEQLQKDFAQYGEILRVKLPLKAGKPNGICFIKFTSPECVEAALKLDNIEYVGRTISVCKAEKGGKAKGQHVKDGKGQGKSGKGKGSVKGNAKGPSESFSKKTGCIVAATGEKTTFADSDEE